MSTDIIQHHEPIDFEALFNQKEAAYVEIDSDDFDNFATGAHEIHSFMGVSESENRVKDAIAAAMAVDEAADIIKKSNAFILIFKFNPDSKRPLMMNELTAVTDIVSTLPEDCDVQWGMTHDTTIGDKVEMVLLANIKE